MLAALGAVALPGAASSSPTSVDGLAAAAAASPVPQPYAVASSGPVPSLPADPAALQALVLQLENDNATLQRQVADLTDQGDGSQQAVDGIAAFYDQMEADRLLMLALRKDLPTTRPEALAYLDQLQKLALASDPANLGTLAQRVLEAAPIYLDWRDKTFATSAESNADYIQSGASGFDTNMRAFRDGALLTVADRLDAVLNLLDRTAR